MEQKTGKKSHGWRYFLLALSLLLLLVILVQNYQPAHVDLLFWEVEVPLTFLLTGTAFLTAISVFTYVWLKGR
jgi:uncharacterized integral membrane protein